MYLIPSTLNVSVWMYKEIIHMKHIQSFILKQNNDSKQS